AENGMDKGIPRCRFGTKLLVRKRTEVIHASKFLGEPAAHLCRSTHNPYHAARLRGCQAGQNLNEALKVRCVIQCADEAKPLPARAPVNRCRCHDAGQPINPLGAKPMLQLNVEWRQCANDIDVRAKPAFAKYCVSKRPGGCSSRIA